MLKRIFGNNLRSLLHLAPPWWKKLKRLFKDSRIRNDYGHDRFFFFLYTYSTYSSHNSGVSIRQQAGDDAFLNPLPVLSIVAILFKASFVFTGR